MNFNEKKISAMLVLEVMGRPAEHLTETLNSLARKISEEKGVKVTDTKVNSPVLIKDQKNFYTSFAEIEVEVENMLNLAILMFKYMPAHIEVISPQNISLTNVEWGDIFSELTRRLHGYEEVARILQAEKVILENKLREIMKSKENKKESGKEKKKQEKEKKNDK